MSGHFAWRAEISQWMQDKQPFITLRALFSRMGVYLCVCAPEEAAGAEREDRKAEWMRAVEECMHGCERGTERICCLRYNRLSYHS